MKRTNFYLSEIQIKKLEQLSKKTGLSMSELLRRAIDEYFEKVKEKPGKSRHGQTME